MRRYRWRGALALAAGCLLAAPACGDRDDSAGEGAGGAGGPALEGDITVLAAASLTDAFDDLADGFAAAHPGTGVEVSYGGSPDLRDQVLAGSPADVLAAANTATMDDVVAAGAAGAPQVFATNTLAIAVPAGNPADVDGLEAFGDEGLLVGLCAEAVPCGELSHRALDAAGVDPQPDTEEPDVRSLLDKVASGELDAGLVYATDVEAAGDAVEGIAVDTDDDLVAEYPIAALADAGAPEVAEAFVDFVLSDQGWAVLASHGFGPPA